MKLTPMMIEVLDSLNKGERVTEIMEHSRSVWVLTGFTHPDGRKVTAAVNGLIKRGLVDCGFASDCVQYAVINAAGRCVLNNDPEQVAAVRFLADFQ
jgi:hypothetical protein